jgi:acyl-coenzyme A thioesterase PaaI-like protein
MMPTSASTDQSDFGAVQQAVLAMPIARALGLRFLRIDAGVVELEMPYADAWSFRPGQMQATAIFAMADFAAIAAAATTLPPGWLNASIDCSLKIVAPANGQSLLARGRIVQAQRLLSICAADVYAVRDGEPVLCATALATARNISPRT